MKIGIVLLSFLFVQSSFASPCGEVVYNKYGLLKKYNYLNLSYTENTKKHGLSSTTGSGTEGTTAVFDPGVSTGVSSSWVQSASTNGACKWGGFFSYVAKRRTEFIAQNIDRLRMQMAMGKGELLNLLVESYFCEPKSQTKVSRLIQGEFVSQGFNSASAAKINFGISKVLKSKLPTQCYIKPIS